MNHVFEEKFENEYRAFEIFAFATFLLFSSECQKIMGKDQFVTALNKIFSIGTVRRQLSIDKKEYKNLLNEQYHGEVLDYYYGLKIQYLYPIIEDTDCAYIPSPYLVINAVTESLLNRLTLGNRKLRMKFGKEVLEAYLFSIYSKLNSVTWIDREFEYYIGKDRYLTPDVLVEEMGNAILFDTKALSPSLKMRQFNAEEINKEIDVYAEDILQLYCRILDLENGHFTLKNHYETNNVFGVVVVLEDAAVPRYRVYNRVFTLLKEKGMSNKAEVCDYIHSHIKIIPLQQIEQTVLIGHSYTECLLNQVDKREKWNDYTFFIPKENIQCISTYEKYCNELKKDVYQFLN